MVTTRRGRVQIDLFIWSNHKEFPNRHLVYVVLVDFWNSFPYRGPVELKDKS